AATQGSHPTTPGTAGTDHFVPEPSRLFHGIAMPAVRLRGELPKLQRLHDISSNRTKARVPYLRAGRKGACRLSERKVPEPGDPVFRHGHATGRGGIDETVFGRADPAYGFGHDETQRRL